MSARQIGLPARLACFPGPRLPAAQRASGGAILGVSAVTDRAIIEAIIEAIGGIITAFCKGIAWGAGITFGVMAMWGYLGGVAT